MRVASRSTPSGSSSKARRSTSRRRKASAGEEIVRGDPLRQLLYGAVAAFFEASATIDAYFIGSFSTLRPQPLQQTFTSRLAATMSTGF